MSVAPQTGTVGPGDDSLRAVLTSRGHSVTFFKHEGNLSGSLLPFWSGSGVRSLEFDTVFEIRPASGVRQTVIVSEEDACDGSDWIKNSPSQNTSELQLLSEVCCLSTYFDFFPFMFSPHALPSFGRCSHLSQHSLFLSSAGAVNMISVGRRPPPPPISCQLNKTDNPWRCCRNWPSCCPPPSSPLASRVICFVWVNCEDTHMHTLLTIPH